MTQYSTAVCQPVTHPSLAEQIWALLVQRARAAGGTASIYSHRQIATDLGKRIESVLPDLMRAWETAGRIIRRPKGKKGAWIEVVDVPPTDRSLIDQPTPLAFSITAGPLDDEANVIATPENAVIDQTDRSALHVRNHDSYKQQHAPARDLDIENHPLYAPLLAAGAEIAVATGIIQRCPDRTPEQLAYALAANARRHERGRAETPTGLVFALWSKGQRLSEEIHEQRTTPNRPERPADDRTPRGRQPSPIPRNHLPDNFGMEFLYG